MTRFTIAVCLLLALLLWPVLYLVSRVAYGPVERVNYTKE